MTMYTKAIRRQMTEDLNDVGDKTTIHYTKERFGEFDSFRSTVRYVARNLGLKIATLKIDNNLVITRLSPSQRVYDVLAQKDKLLFVPHDVAFFNEYAHLLKPSPDDPLYDLKMMLADFLPSVSGHLDSLVQKYKEEGVYDEIG